LSLDRISITGITEHCILGARPSERHNKRPVFVDIDLFCDLGKAAAADDLNETVDYSAVAGIVRETIRGSQFRLVEALAGRICDVCLELDLVVEVEVVVRKPGALGPSSHASVCLRRKR
jgi:FolB domain-containing protein